MPGLLYEQWATMAWTFFQARRFQIMIGPWFLASGRQYVVTTRSLPTVSLQRERERMPQHLVRRSQCVIAENIVRIGTLLHAESPTRRLTRVGEFLPQVLNLDVERVFPWERSLGVLRMTRVDRTRALERDFEPAKRWVAENKLGMVTQRHARFG